MRLSYPAPVLSVSLLALSAAAVFPAAAGALGLPPTFPRTITRTLTKQDVRVTRFEVTTRAAANKKMRVTVHVGAVSLKGPQPLLIAVGPCTSGTLTSPYCPPAATSRLKLGVTALDATRSFLLARPSPRRDALRVTLTAGNNPVPFRTSNVGGGGGTAELLLNAGTWRFKQGTPWGLVAASPAGVQLESVLFNSRRYEWRGTTPVQTTVTTTIGYADAPLNWDFNDLMRPERPFGFHRTPGTPVQTLRTAPRVFLYAAKIGGAQLFTVRLPLPALDPRSAYEAVNARTAA